MKTDYRWKDQEVGEFYSHVATRRPGEQNRGGGIRVTDNASYLDVEHANNNLDILYYYEKQFKEHGFWKQARIIGKTRSNIFAAVFNWNRDVMGELTIPNEERGKNLITGTLSREMRMMCNAFDSVLNGKPNEMARAIFA